MTEWIDQKYIMLLAPRLSRFKQKDSTLFNFRCPICGDSSKTEYKARGYIYQNKNDYWFSCHNCNVSMSLRSFIKRIDPTMYTEYVLERYKEDAPAILSKGIQPKKVDLPIYDDDVFSKLPKISELPSNHPGVEYIRNRKIPENQWHRLRWTDDAVALIKHFKPTKFKNVTVIEGGVVLPCYTEDNRVNYFQIRLLTSIKDGLRYITTTIDESKPKLFGLEQLNTNQRYYIIEGPFDSLFIPNSVAMMGSHISYDFPKEHAVFVYDNEPRNKEILSQMKRRINEGYKICIWPFWKTDKDINDMVLRGHSPEDVLDTINRFTFEGLTAELELAKWAKRH